MVQYHLKSDITMEFLQNKNAFTPHFISSILQSVEHRFIYVMECETRQYDENGKINYYSLTLLPKQTPCSKLVA